MHDLIVPTVPLSDSDSRERLIPKPARFKPPRAFMLPEGHPRALIDYGPGQYYGLDSQPGIFAVDDPVLSIALADSQERVFDFWDNSHSSWGFPLEKGRFTLMDLDQESLTLRDPFGNVHVVRLQDLHGCHTPAALLRA